MEETPEQKSRRLFPEFSKVMDEYRAVFGPGVRCTWAREGDNEMGKRQPPVNQGAN